MSALTITAAILLAVIAVTIYGSRERTWHRTCGGHHDTPRERRACDDRGLS